MARNNSYAKALEQILVDIGLNESERHVFTLLIAEESPMRVTDIARMSKLNRTTTYGILHSLAERGLVTGTEVRGVLKYQTIEPSLLADHLERAKDRLHADTKRLRDILPDIKRVRSGATSYRPSVKFYEGKDGVKQIYENILRESKSKRVYGFVGTEALYKLMDEDFIQYYLTKRPLRDVHWTTIAGDSAESRAMKSRDAKELRTTYILPPGNEYQIELASYDDTTMIVSYDEDRPIGITITDQKIADTVKTLVTYISSTLPAK